MHVERQDPPTVADLSGVKRDVILHFLGSG
jgi:hypothetical protein